MEMFSNSFVTFVGHGFWLYAVASELGAKHFRKASAAGSIFWKIQKHPAGRSRK